MHRTGMSLFGVTVRWYGVLIVLGIALGVALAWRREARLGVPKDTTLDLALICVPAAIVGARLYYVAFSWDQFVGRPWWSVFALWEGGMAIYGGVIAGVLAGAIYARAKGLSFRKLADLVAPSIALGQAVGRWGNFVNQEAHGAAVGNPALRFFPMAVEIGGEWYYATFFYESVWCFLIVAALLAAEGKRWFRREGDGMLAYVFLYAMERAVVEGMRTDSLTLGPMRVSQALSLLAALVVTVVWAARCPRTAWRALGPGCVALTAVAAVAGGTGWTLAAAVASLAAVFAMVRSIDQHKIDRGEIG